MTGRPTPTVPRPRMSSETAVTPARPFWQTEPCPSWCKASSSLFGHQDSDDYDDLHHFHYGTVIPLSLYTALELAGDDKACEAPWLTLSLLQHYRAAAPDVIVCVPVPGDTYHEHDVRLTAAEARQLAAALLATLAEIDATEDGVR